MKPILLMAMLILQIAIVKAQYHKGARGLKLGLAYSTNNTLGVSFGYIFSANLFTVGLNQQYNGQKGRRIKERKTNYGLGMDGADSYLWMMDVGYGRLLSDHITLSAELSMGNENFYLNYSDHRFSGDGYYAVINRKAVVGGGIYCIYNFTKAFGIGAGYNNLKKATIGLSFRGFN